MLKIECPWCGHRDQTEFSYGGEAHIVRPPEPDNLNDEEWGDYSHGFKYNPAGRGINHKKADILN